MSAQTIEANGLGRGYHLMKFLRRQRRLAAVSRLPCCREICAHVLSKAARRGGKAAFLITSVTSMEGKTTIACNVAKLVAEAGARCVLATADERPVRALLGNDRPASAIERVISGELALDLGDGDVAVLQIADLCAPELFRAEGPAAWGMERQITIIDGPVIRHVFAQTLVPLVDGVMLVADTRQSSLRSVLTAKDRIDKLGGEFLGVILNRHRSPIPRLFDEWADHA
jgi:Mrp family chromosome partitioning ATPase